MQTLDEIATSVARDPDDVELRRVYADALQDSGDPRGEHIALAFEAERGDRFAQVRVREIQRTIERELAALVPKLVLKIEWRLGFIEHLGVTSRKPPASLPKLEVVLARPELLALRSFDTRGCWPQSKPVAKTLAALPILLRGKPVRRLGIGPAAIGDAELAPIFEAFALDGLALTTSEPASALEAIAAHGKIVDLEFGTSEMPPAKVIKGVIKACSRELTRLVVHGIGGLVKTPLTTILDGTAFPKLRDFGILAPANTTKQVLRELVKSKLIGKLTAFGFAAKDMEGDRLWLVDNMARFAHARLYTAAIWPDRDAGHDAQALGLLLKSFGRHADAIPWLDLHLAFCGGKGDHRNCLEELGEAQLEAGRATEAIEPLERSIAAYKNKVTPQSRPVFQTYGQTLDALGRFADAGALWERLLDGDDDGWMLRWYGHALMGLHRYDKADAVLGRAIDNSYDDEYLAWGHAMRGEVRWEMRGEPAPWLAQAREIGERSDTVNHVGTSPRDASRHAQWIEGKIARQRGDLALAKTRFEGAGTIGQYDLAVTLVERGELERALAVFETIDRDDRDDRAHVLLALGRGREALVMLDAHKHDMGGARACIQFALGEYDEAIAALDDYGVRSRAACPRCTYRHAVGGLLQTLVRRRAGHEACATPALSGSCTSDLCARAAAATAIVAAFAREDHAGVEAQTAALRTAIAAGRGGAMTPRLWELRAAAGIAGAPLAIIEAVERAAVAP